MQRCAFIVLVAVFTVGVLTSCHAQPADGESKVNLSVQDAEPVAVAAQITEQTGVQVALTEWTEGTVTGSLEEFDLEEAVRSLAETLDASWIRAYILETEPPDEPYTAAELLEMLDEVRTAVFEGLTDEERGELMAAWRERIAPEEAADQPEGEGRRMRGGAGMRGFGMFGGDAGGPGGGVAQMARPEGAGGPEGGAAPAGEGGPRGRGDFIRYEDPIRRLLLPARSDTISLDLTGASLEAAVSAFTRESCFLVVVEEGLQGEVTVQLEEAPLSEALDAIAGAAEAQWRKVYIVSQPRELTDAELAERQAGMEQRREQRFERRWAEFWQSSPQERAESIQRRVDRLSNMSERRLERFKARRGPRRLSRMTQYSATLSPEQRMEIKPLLQAIAKIMQ